ncbi:DUF3560 domain-containing protein [Nonomuraea basaltis]|uniref:DUF3560 domain-containing protein n=1 Tax=Nonomuraea basaltis TaxID=2495887 RepID=UPI00110C46A4|nr:DUF3560 domain-containing protein [Nonomuraea basaltis]TMR99583.1 DUF3560 domain-containing protein [Nonomuraea basaltis]
MITIRHTHEDGTLIYGTRKGDGVFEIVKKWENGGFRYFPSMRMIGLRNSRDRIADRWAINAATEALRAAGHDVEVEIDDTFRDRAQVLEDKADRLEDRRDALETKADRHAGAADAAHNRAHQISERFAAGQPILVGHHSERGARADRKRMDQAMRKSIDENDQAQEVARRANAVGNQLRRSATPAVTARRIKTAEAELRKIEKNLDGYQRTFRDHAGNPYYIEKHEPAQGDYREMQLARKAQLENQLEYDRAQLAAAVEVGEYVEYGKHNVHVGDLVTYWFRDRRRRVVKVNKVTVSVESGYSWPDKVKFTDILAVECPHGEDGPDVLAPKRSAPKAPVRANVEVPAIDVAALTARIVEAEIGVPRDSEAFMSPPTVVERVLDAAELERGMTVLEPSAGNGALAKAAAAESCEVHCVERYPVLSKDLLDVPGIVGLTTGDFLEITPDQYPAKFDRVLMNPPFSKGQDIQHVRHALRFLRLGGLLIAVMSNGVAWHKDKTATSFRELVEQRGGHIEPLPDEAFAVSGTDVRTVLVVIPAPEE